MQLEIKNWHITDYNKDNLIKKINELDLSKGYVANIKIKSQSRSLEQNRRYWKLVTLLGEQLGYTPDETHDILRFKFLRNAVEIEGERLPLLQSTTKLSVEEMGAYMQQIETWAGNFGFVFEGE